MNIVSLGGPRGAILGGIFQVAHKNEICSSLQVTEGLVVFQLYYKSCPGFLHEKTDLQCNR